MYDNDLTEFPEAEAEGEGDESDGEEKHADASGEHGAAAGEAGGGVPMDAETAEAAQEAAAGAADAGEEPDAAGGQAADEVANEAIVTEGAPVILLSRFLAAFVCVVAGPNFAYVHFAG